MASPRAVAPRSTLRPIRSRTSSPTSRAFCRAVDRLRRYALSPADTVVVSTGANLPPLAELGPNRLVTVGVPALLDATVSDPNDDPLTFAWALLGRPAGEHRYPLGAVGDAECN